MVQWLGLGALTAEGLGSIPDWETKIPQAEWHNKTKQNKTHRLTDAEKRLVVARGVWVGRWEKWVKGLKLPVMK